MPTYPNAVFLMSAKWAESRWAVILAGPSVRELLSAKRFESKGVAVLTGASVCGLRAFVFRRGLASLGSNPRLSEQHSPHGQADKQIAEFLMLAKWVASEWAAVLAGPSVRELLSAKWVES